MPHSPHPFLNLSTCYNFPHYHFIPTKFNWDASLWGERRMHIAASVDISRRAAFWFFKLSPWQQDRKQEVVFSIGMVWWDNACELLAPLLSCHVSALPSGYCRQRRELPMRLSVCVRMLECTRADGSSALVVCASQGGGGRGYSWSMEITDLSWIFLESKSGALDRKVQAMTLMHPVSSEAEPPYLGILDRNVSPGTV